MADKTMEQEEMEVNDEELDLGQESDEESGEEGSSSCSEEDFEPPPPLATTRSRRANAGNKMHELMSTTKPADDAEEYFTSSNGKYDFKEPELDDEYASPTSSDDDDEVDSDFDRDEDEQEPGEEEDEETKLRREARRQRKAHMKKHKQWAVARLGGKVVPPNACDPKTQAERLKEAEVTEKLNTESLKRFEELELERKKRQTKQFRKRAVVGPVVSFVSKPGVSVAVYPELKEFPQKKQIYPACAVTGKPAKYIDPLTELPYSDAEAFKVIRRAYKEFLAAKGLSGADVTTKENVSA
ncbi:Protein C17E4.6 [Aphelenchoides avenae]|nr:Protein C17E4.6 [Aphelenchus avenae]